MTSSVKVIFISEIIFQHLCYDLAAWPARPNELAVRKARSNRHASLDFLSTLPPWLRRPMDASRSLAADKAWSAVLVYYLNLA
jgi:hypothetical protein